MIIPQDTDSVLETGKKIAYGAGWMVLFKFAQRGLGLISTLILVRLLVPDDFGLIAMSMSVIALLDHLGAFKFDIVLIQNQSAEPKHFNTAWTFNVAFGVFSFFALLLLAGPAARFYNEPDLAVVMICLAVVPLMTGLENIGVVMFRKEMEFDKEFRFLLAKRVIGFLITVPLAFILRNYWALVIGMLGGQIGATWLSYRMHPYRPRITIEAWRELFSFSKWLMVNSFLGFLRLRSADIIIGRILGTRALGLYNVAFDFSTVVTSQLAAPVNRAIFPGFAMMSAKRDTLRQGYLSVLAALSMIMVPAALGLNAVAEPFVNVVLGEQWSDAAPLFRILALVGLISAMSTTSLSVYLALAKPWIITGLHSLALAAVLPLAIWLGTSYGIAWAAGAYLLIATAMLPIDLTLVGRMLGIGPLEFAIAVWRPVVATAVMYLSVTAFLGHPYIAAGPPGEMVALVSAVVIGGLIFVMAVLFLWRLSGRPDSIERTIFEKVSSLTRNQSRDENNQNPLR